MLSKSPRYLHQVPPSGGLLAAMEEVIVKIMVELLSTIALVTKKIKQKLPRECVLVF